MYEIFKMDFMKSQSECQISLLISTTKLKKLLVARKQNEVVNLRF